MKQPNFIFENGIVVMDTITKFTGTIVCRCDNITGCNTYFIQPETNEKGEIRSPEWVDEMRIKVLNAPKKEVERSQAPGAVINNTSPPKTHPG